MLQSDIIKDNKYRFGQEMPRKRKSRTASLKMAHVDNGFPHIGYRGLCMCLDTCCHREAGCRCIYCPCKTGKAEH